MKKIILLFLFIYINVVLMAQTPTLTAALTSSTNVSCYNLCDGTASVTAFGGTTPYTYSWNSIPVQTNVNASGLCPGSYTCIVTDWNGSTANTFVIITQPTPVTVTSSDVSICPGSCTILNASASGGSGAINFSWNPGNLTGASVSVCPVSTTTYTITGTDFNGCTGITNVQVVVSCTGVEENIGIHANVNIYPNPSNGTIVLNYTLKQNDIAEIKMYDLTGKLVEKHELDASKNELQINTNLNNGIYLYQVIVNDKVVKSDKLVIIKER